MFSLFSKRYYRPVCMERFGMEVVDATVPSRMKNSIAYRPNNPGLVDALKEALGIEAPAKPTA